MFSKSAIAESEVTVAAFVNYQFFRRACTIVAKMPVINKLSLKLYTKLFTIHYTLKNNVIQLDLGYRKPQDHHVTLKYKNHFKWLYINLGCKINNLACEYIVQTTSLNGLNINRLQTRKITTTFEQTKVRITHAHTHTWLVTPSFRKSPYSL